MKSQLKKIAFLACATLALAGCKNEDISRQRYDNKIYISADNYVDMNLVKASSVDFSRQLVARIAKPVSHDVTVHFQAVPQLLDHYRKAYYDDKAELLASDYYQIPEGGTKIQAGNVVSTPVDMKFVNLINLDREKRYVLPVQIVSADGVAILESARTMYYVFKGAALINVVADMNQNRAYPMFQNAAALNNLSSFTLEAMVYPNSFNRLISTLMGIEGKFLLRFGDAGLDPNQLQLATSDGNETNPDLKFDTGKWSHIALTFDRGSIVIYVNGVQKLATSKNLSSVNFGVHYNNENSDSRGFWLGYSYDGDRYFDGRMSEVRIWNRALTKDEIGAANHFYWVDTQSSGLVAYWKFDEGTGSSIKDYSPSGNNLVLQKEPKWFSVTLPEK